MPIPFLSKIDVSVHPPWREFWRKSHRLSMSTQIIGAGGRLRTSRVILESSSEILPQDIPNLSSREALYFLENHVTSSMAAGFSVKVESCEITQIPEDISKRIVPAIPTFPLDKQATTESLEAVLISESIQALGLLPLKPREAPSSFIEGFFFYLNDRLVTSNKGVKHLQVNDLLNSVSKIPYFPEYSELQTLIAEFAKFSAIIRMLYNPVTSQIVLLDAIPLICHVSPENSRVLLSNICSAINQERLGWEALAILEVPYADFDELLSSAMLTKYLETHKVFLSRANDWIGACRY